MRKRILSILLCLVMVVGLFPTMAFAAGGSGTASNPIVVTTFEELKAALEKDTVGLGMQYIKVPNGINIEKLLKLESYNSAFNVIRQKTLIVDGTVTVIAAAGTAAVRSMFSVHGPGNRLDIRGSGSLTFKANTNASCNAVVDVNDEGMLNVSGGVTLSGTFNTAVYGMAVYNYGGTVNIDNATLTGETAGVSYGAAVHANGGTTNIKNATLKSSVSPGANAISRKGSGTIFVGKDASLTIENSIIHTTDGVTDGHSIYLEKGSTKHISDYLVANQKIYRQSDKVQLSADGTSLTDSVYITDDVSEKINAVSLTVGPLITREMISDLACSYSPSIKMTLTNFNVYKGLNNTTDKIEGENTPYDPDQSYTVMYVFRANEGFKFSTEATKNVTVTGGDFWMADTYGGTTNAIRVFVNIPASTIDKVSLNIKPKDERTKISDLACSYSPAGGMTLTNFNVYKGLNNTSDKIEGENTLYDPNQSYTVMYVFRANEGFKFSTEATKNVTVTGGDFWMADSFGGTTDAIRVFVTFPREEVPHSIAVTNGRGTANPTSAMAGEPVTVTAKDDTANNMMFTQWYTKTAGVTFADVTKQKTTFVMPNCDVQVYPGYQKVSFTNQPTGSWLSSVDDSKVYFAFSQPITSWKLVNEDDTTLASGDAESANALVAATLGPKPDKTEMTCRVIVTSNGQNFTSNEFTLKWYNVPGAPDVTVYPEGGKFVETLDVKLKTPNTYWGILYTTDGSDPYDKSGETWTKNPNAIEEYDSTQVKISKDTTIKACLYNSEGYSNMEKFGDIATCDFTKVDFTPPVADPPSGTSFYDSLNVSLSTDIVNAKIMWSYNDQDVNDLSTPGKWKEYEPEKESITLSGSYGMHGFYALTGIRMEHPDGYTYWVHSDKQDYSYPRISYATIADASVTGKVNEEITPVDVSITLSGDVFAEDLTAGVDVSSWFTNRPAGLTAKVKDRTNYTKTLVITISGTPTATSAAAISVEMPKSALRYTGTGTAVEQTVLSNPKAVYNIGTDVAHEHTFGEWTWWNDSEHYQSCTCGEMKFEAHNFGNWMLDTADDTKHYKECSVCGHKVKANHVESSKITDTAADIGTPGAWHTVCVDCGKQMNTGTFPALVKIDVAKLTVAKPVQGVAADMASTADATYTVANTEWTAADGATLTIGEKFKPGTAYTVKITLEAKNSNVFTADSTYNKIEGKDAKLVTAVTGYTDSVILTYTFDATDGTYVPTKPAITTVALPDGKVGDAYSQTLAATGTNPIAWSIEVGDLPDGLTLVGDTIKGTPSKAGDFKFTVKATNSGGSVTKELTIKIADAEAAKYHNVTLSGAGTGATGAGSHAAGTTVNIYAGTKSGYTFNGWTSDDVTVLSASSKNASFVMPPDKDVTVKANWVYNGGGSSGGGYTYYTIKATAGVNGSISPTGNVSVREGRDQTFTITPNKGYAVAKVLIDSKNVGAVKSYTFENVKKNHTIEVVFMKASGNPQTGVFVDVPEGSYYEEAVNWAVEKGITTGTDATHFSPDGICTRAQAVTFLWRAAGSPAAKSAVMPFTDVKAGSYYYDAVLWAVENGITKGTSDTMFSPDATCSRAQIVTFLWRSQKSPAAGTANPFTDVKASAYYADAVLWAVKEDVTKGTTNTTFSPDANCTRAQIVTFIWRALAE